MEQTTAAQPQNKMGTEPMLKLILSMSLPAIFSMLVQSLYNVVDSFFVSKISENALTAVSYAAPAQMLMISVAVGTGIGINSLVSRRLGEGNQKAADNAATHGLLLGVANWVVFALLGIFFSGTFIHSMTSNPEIAEWGTQYLSIVLIASTGLFVELVLEKTLQATGNMIYPMIFQLIGAVINIILDPIFIFGLLGVPKFGVAGAAIATVLGQIIAMVYALIIALCKKHRVHIGFKGFQFHGKTVKDIYAVGFPSMLMQSVGSVLITVMNLILGTFTETAVAVYGIYFKLQSFVFMPVFGLTHGVLPIMGFNYGAGNKKRLMDALKMGCYIALGIMAAGTLLFMLLPKELLLIFDASDNMLEIGIPALRMISLCFIPAAIGILFSTLFQAIGMGGKSLLISILRQVVILIPVALLMAQFGLGYVWTAFPIAETVSLVASIVIFLQVKKHKVQTISA